MEVTSFLRNLRTSPRKVRQVVDLVRGKDVAKAEALLEFTVNKSSEPVLKLLRSALASAAHDLKLDASNLYISKITVDEGPKLKRSHPMSRGRAYPIIKRTSHVMLVLSERNPTKPVVVAKSTPVKEKQESKKETSRKTATPKLKRVTKKK